MGEILASTYFINLETKFTGKLNRHLILLHISTQKILSPFTRTVLTQLFEKIKFNVTNSMTKKFLPISFNLVLFLHEHI